MAKALKFPRPLFHDAETTLCKCCSTSAYNLEARSPLRKDRSHRIHTSHSFDGTVLTNVQRHHHLEIIFSSDLRWEAHVDHVLDRAAPLLHTLTHLRSNLSRRVLPLYYSPFVRPMVQYAGIAWSKIRSILNDRLERFQWRAVKIILRRPSFTSSDHQ